MIAVSDPGVVRERDPGHRNIIKSGRDHTRRYTSLSNLLIWMKP